jgi:hypothetical protein
MVRMLTVIQANIAPEISQLLAQLILRLSRNCLGLEVTISATNADIANVTVSKPIIQMMTGTNTGLIKVAHMETATSRNTMRYNPSCSMPIEEKNSLRFLIIYRS